MFQKKIIVFTDGGSRGNPGPSAVGVIIKDPAGKLIKSYAAALGERTNNEAEYEAVIFAMQKAKTLFGKVTIREMALEINLDSELVARQLEGKYKVEEERLWSFFMKVWNLKTEFADVKFKSIPRERNREADKLVNEVLDRTESRLF